MSLLVMLLIAFIAAVVGTILGGDEGGHSDRDERPWQPWDHPRGRY